MATNMKSLNGYGFDAAALGGKAPEYYLQPRNLLDNSDFTNPVNQRGQTSYTGQVYGIDRWYGGRISQKVEIRNTDVTVTATSSSYAGIKQKIANIDRLSSKTVTLATYVYSTVGVAVGFTDGDDNTVSETVDNRSGSRVILCTCTVPSNATPDTFIPRILLRTTAQNDYMRCYWAALYEGSYTADTLPPYVPKGKHVEMLNCGVPLAPRNLLDNSDFTNPVNQRGQTSYMGSDEGVYTIDRWKIWGNSPLNVNDGYIETVDRVYQYFPLNTFKNTVHTFAAKKFDGTIITTTFNPTQEPTQDIYGNLLGSDAWSTVIGLSNGQYVWAALYEGSYTADTLPPYVPKGYAAELAECQRYYYQSFSGSSAKKWDGAIVREAVSASRITDVSFPQTMRIEKPTVTLYSPVSGNVNKVSEYLSDTDIDAEAGYRSRYRFMLTKTTSAFEIGKHYAMHYTVSADL